MTRLIFAVALIALPFFALGSADAQTRLTITKVAPIRGPGVVFWTGEVKQPTFFCKYVQRAGQYVSVATLPETPFIFIPYVSNAYSTYMVQAQRIAPLTGGYRFDPIPAGAKATGVSATLGAPSLNCTIAYWFRAVDKPVVGAIVAGWKEVKR